MASAELPLAELFQAHRQGLAGAVRSVLGPTVDVAEVLQDAFLKCWQGWQRGTRVVRARSEALREPRHDAGQVVEGGTHDTSAAQRSFAPSRSRSGRMPVVRNSLRSSQSCIEPSL